MSTEAIFNTWILDRKKSSKTVISMEGLSLGAGVRMKCKHCGVQKPMLRGHFLLPPWVQGLNSGFQACIQRELSCWSNKGHL